MKLPVKYINNNPELGIKIDWKRVLKVYNSLGCPKDAFCPLHINLDENGIVITLSPRSYGKTTGWLIVGLIVYALYGQQMTYMRQKTTDIEPRHIRDLYQVVLKYKYIEKIFKEEGWNSISYRAQRWTLEKIDETGAVVAKDKNYCTYCDSIDRSDRIKSVQNLPECCLIVYDEFISNDYLYNEPIRFFDMVKTIFRDRRNGNVILIANTIDKNSEFFDELEIRPTIDMMGSGDIVNAFTTKGTRISIEIIAIQQSSKRVLMNKRFFGFSNPKFASITGEDVWAISDYPHIPYYRGTDTGDCDAWRRFVQDEDKREQPEMLCNRVFVKHAGRYVKLAIVKDSVIGICVFVTPATKIYDDSLVLTTEYSYAANVQFGFGDDQIPAIKWIWYLYSRNRFYYARNSEGALIESYIKSIIATTRARHM